MAANVLCLNQMRNFQAAEENVATHLGVRLNPVHPAVYATDKVRCFVLYLGPTWRTPNWRKRKLHERILQLYRPSTNGWFHC